MRLHIFIERKKRVFVVNVIKVQFLLMDLFQDSKGKLFTCLEADTDTFSQFSDVLVFNFQLE
jgi:hypothetical protein